MVGFTNELVAVKVFKTTLFATEIPDLERNRKKQLEEASIIKKFDHSNVITLLNLVETDQEICLVFSLMDHSLEDEIYSKQYKYNQQRTKDIL